MYILNAEGWDTDDVLPRESISLHQFISAGHSGKITGADTVSDSGRDHYRTCHFFRCLLHVWRWCEEGEEG